MTIRSLAPALTLFLAAAGWAQTAPKVLIVQTKAPVESGNDLNVPMRGFFAQEFDEDGRLEAVSWSMSDPLFRKAVEQKTIVDPPESPSLGQAADAASKLGCEYIFVLTALRHGSNVMSNAYMYKGKREIWKAGTVSQTLVQDVLQIESTARSLARTWILQMGQGPLKGLKPRPKSQTPDPDPGIKPVPPPQNDPVVQADDFAIRAEYERLTRLGEHRAALQLVRDAVDAEPLNLARRQLLIQVLLERGFAADASKEARRAAGLFPEEVALWRLCARTSIGSGDYPQAIRDLNEAIAREPENAETRMLLGLAQLMAGRNDYAIEHLSASLRIKPSPEALAFRSAASFARGDAEAAKADLAEFTKSFAAAGPDDNSGIRVFLLRFLATSSEAWGAEQRDFLQKVRLKPADTGHNRTLALCISRVEGVQQLAAALGTSTKFPKASAGVDLALNLLRQSLSETQVFLSSKNEEALGDATISLGEMFRALEAVKKELTNPA